MARIANEVPSRPFLYPNFTWAFKKIERIIAAMGEQGQKVLGAAESKSATSAKESG